MPFCRFSITLNGPSQFGANFHWVGYFLSYVLIHHTKSPSLKVLGLTLALNLFVALLFTAFSRIFHFSRSSCSKFKSLRRHSSFIPKSSIFLCSVGSPTSTGIIAPVPYIRLKGVSPIDVSTILVIFLPIYPFAFSNLLLS